MGEGVRRWVDGIEVMTFPTGTLTGVAKELGLERSMREIRTVTDPDEMVALRAAKERGHVERLDAPRFRPGYPQLDDPEHPLWEAQQAGWPDHAPHEAMAEAVKHMKRGRGDSAQHPGFDPGFIVNPQAERPEDADADDVLPASEAGRR